MAATTGGSIAALSSFRSSSSRLSRKAKSGGTCVPVICRVVFPQRNIACFAVQESSSATVAAETKKKEAEEAVEEETAAAEKPKRKPAGKAPAKPLPQMMEEDVIPSLKSTLQAQDDITELELSFNDNKLEGSFLKKGYPYSFWAFFPNGLTGPKGFSLSSYGNGVSTVEPFLVDEKKITEKHIVFWVEKRLAAQGIIPVWKE
ncbi:uncharacterized protein LOC116016582 [Ipomoea triloba]|uniref:uncharacterized protein LOC116016582 n=1 Tax=Ipomoea triloba TaxID=35885 RepID=UPI00125DD3E0|nr:uncharacterized protein LOC116016582 [Ipomoea triloba]